MKNIYIVNETIQLYMDCDEIGAHGNHFCLESISFHSSYVTAQERINEILNGKCEKFKAGHSEHIIDGIHSAYLTRELQQIMLNEIQIFGDNYEEECEIFPLYTITEHQLED